MFKRSYSFGMDIKSHVHKYRNLYYGALLLGSFSGMAYYMVKYFDSKSSTHIQAKVTEQRPFLSSSGIPKNEMIPDIPNHAQYLIVGGGVAGVSAAKSIKACDPSAKILIVNDQEFYPYALPPLSKGALVSEEFDFDTLKYKQWNNKYDSLFVLNPEFFRSPRSDEYLKSGGIAIVRNQKVTGLDLRTNSATLSNGWTVTFEKCLLATGSAPLKPEWMKNLGAEILEKISLYGNIVDFKRLYEIAHSGKDIAIVGSGFLAGELAFALSSILKAKAKVTLITSDSESGFGTAVVLASLFAFRITRTSSSRMFEPSVFKSYSEGYQSVLSSAGGVTVLTSAEITNATLSDSGQVNLSYRNTGEKNQTAPENVMVADYVVVALDAKPNTDLARSGGLEIDPKIGGYVVNAELLARENVWVAGDAASYYDVMLNERRRIQHYEHAISTGRTAGENMSSAERRPFYHQSMFWSDLGEDASFEGVGLIDSTLDTVVVFIKKDGSIWEKINPFVDDTKKFAKGIVYYVKNNRIVGILFWNIYDKILTARRILENHSEHTDYIAVTKKLLSTQETDSD